MYVFAERFAREQAIAIAQDRTAHFPPEARKDALWLIDAALQKWKLEQAAPDGTVEIEFLVGLLGAGAGHASSLTLADLASGRTRKFVQVSTVRPEQCAGLGVSSAADLFFKLHSEHYAPLMQLPEAIRFDIAIALLIERDGQTMPIVSLAFWVRQLWAFLWETAKAYREILVARDRKSADQNANLHAHAALGHAKNKAERDATISRMGIDIFMQYPDQDNDFVAAKILKTVRDNNWKLFAKMTQAGIKRRLGGTRQEALARLARNPR